MSLQNVDFLADSDDDVEEQKALRAEGTEVARAERAGDDSTDDAARAASPALSERSAASSQVGKLLSFHSTDTNALRN
jgi:hypothetical protein